VIPSLSALISGDRLNTTQCDQVPIGASVKWKMVSVHFSGWNKELTPFGFRAAQAFVETGPLSGPSWKFGDCLSLCQYWVNSVLHLFDLENNRYQTDRPITGRCVFFDTYVFQAGSRPPARLAGVSGGASVPAEGNGIESVSGGGVAPSGVLVLGALPEVGEGRVTVVFMSTLSNGPEATGGLSGTGGTPTPGTGAAGGKGAIGCGIGLEPLELIRRSRLLNRRSSSFNLRSRRSTRPTTSPRANVAVPDEVEDNVGVPNP
jgi:hypothetical protein